MSDTSKQSTKIDMIARFYGGIGINCKQYLIRYDQNRMLKTRFRP